MLKNIPTTFPAVKNELPGKSPALHVAMASPEITPFAKTGGLSDMVSALAKSLEHFGVKISLVMPAHRSVLQGGFALEDTGVKLAVPINNRREEGSLLKAKTGKDITVYFIQADRYFDRENLYGTPEGDYPDNAGRFIFFSRAVLEVLKLDPPDVLHAHDWQSAMSIAFLKTQPHLYPELAGVKTAFTVHNLGYQGLFARGDWHLMNLDERYFNPRDLEFYDKINFLKGGLVFADALTTVSPSYAEEIKTPEYGFGLDGLFRERAASLTGILNGADYEVWNPQTDPYIIKTYSLDNFNGKMDCKADIQRTFDLPQDRSIPLLSMVTRLSAQKGIDLLEKTIENLLSRNIQLIIMGTGDKSCEDAVQKVALRYPQNLAVRIAFDERMAHQILAGADIFLMPSRYEPAGLTQLYSLKYGTVPVVRATGGLKDSIKEFDGKTGSGNGFTFGLYEPDALMEAISRALTLFQHRGEWSSLMRLAMSADFSWERSARAYMGIYQSLAKS
jgi:starch synthase